MVSFAQPLFWQVRYLVTGLTKKNYRSSVSELHQLINLYGFDAQVFFLRTLIEELQFQDGRLAGGAAVRDQLKLQLLQAELGEFENDEHFGVTLRQAIESWRDVTEEFVVQFCRVVKLSHSAQVSLVVACLLSTSEVSRREAAKLLRSKLRESSAANAGARTQQLCLPERLLHTLLTALLGPDLDGIFDDRERETICKQLLESNPDADFGHGPCAGLAHLQRSGLSRLARQDKPATPEPVAAFASNGLQEDSVRACDLVAEISCGLDASDTKEAVKIALSAVPRLETRKIAEIVCVSMQTSRKTAGENTHEVLAAKLLAAVERENWSGDGHEFGRSSETPDRSAVVRAILEAVQECTADVAWEDVFDLIFDLPELRIVGDSCTKTLYEAFLSVKGGEEARFPLNSVLRLRRNTEAQLRFLLSVVSSDVSILDFTCNEALSGLQPPVKDCWASCGYIEILLELAEIEDYGAVRDLFDSPLQSCPDVLLVMLCLIEDRSRGALKTELLSKLMPSFFGSASSSSTAVQVVLAERAPMQLRSLLRIMYDKDPVENFPRIRDILAKSHMSDFKSEFIGAPPTELSCQLALSESLQEPAMLRTWLSGTLNEYKDMAAFGISRFLRVRMPAPSDANATELMDDSTIAPLSASWLPGIDETSTVQAFLNALQKAVPLLSQDSVRTISGLKKLAKETYQRLTLEEQAPTPVVNARPQSVSKEPPSVAVPNGPQVVVPEHERDGEAYAERLEALSNHYFEKLYAKELSVPELIEMLKGFKAEPVGTLNKDVYARMVQRLFDECRHFAKYQTGDLIITGMLFGSLINYDLVEVGNMPLAFRCVLEALRRPLHTKMFDFGVLALEEFLEKLPTWPQLCQHIARVDNLIQEYPTYVAYANAILEALPMNMQRAATLKMEDLEACRVGRLPKAPAKLHPERDTGTLGERPRVAAPAQPPPPEPPPVTKMTVPMPKSAPPAPLPPLRPPPVTVETLIPPPSIAPPTRPIDTQPPAAMPSVAPPAKPPSMAPPTRPPDAQVPAASPSVETKAAPTALTAAPGAANGGGAQTVEQLLSDPSLQGEKPPNWFVDTTMQIFNSLARDNMEAKAEQMGAVLIPEYCAWLAYYAVKNRASKEVNNHPIYIDFFERCKLPKIMEQVTNTTYDLLRALLKAVDQAVVSTSHRTVLKNLGCWLGQVTLARNKPLKSRQIDLKMLLIDGFEHGRLTAVLPLVCKIMEAVQKSKVYKPPNPWTMAILSLLAEIHDIPSLRTNLMFEVEVLCRNLEIKIAEIQRTECLAGKRPPPGSPDISAPRQQQAAEPSVEAVQARDAVFPAGASAHSGALRAPSPPADAAKRFGEASERTAGRAGGQCGGNYVAAYADSGASQATEDFILPNLPTFVTLNPSFVALLAEKNIHLLVPNAVDRAIKEVINAVVERSVTIACLTTLEVVRKDFAADPDESALRNAAQLMVSCVATSLALVSCREPLRVALITHLWNLFVTLSSEEYMQDNPTFEHIVHTIALENVNLGCSIIEKAVVHRALGDINKAIAPAVQSRQDHKARNGGLMVPYLDTSYSNETSSHWPHALPEVLRSKPGQGAQQLKIYKHFQTIQASSWRAAVCSNLPELNYPISGSLNEQAFHAAQSGHSFAGPLLCGRDNVFAMNGDAASMKPSQPAASEAAGEGIWGSAMSQRVQTVVSAVWLLTQQLIQRVTNDLPLLPPMDCSSATVYGVDDALDACRALATHPMEKDLAQLLQQAPQQVAHCPSPEYCVVELAKQTYNKLVEALDAPVYCQRPDTVSPTHIAIEIHLALLDSVQARPELFSIKEVLLDKVSTGLSGRSCHVDLVASLCRYRLLKIGDLDRTLASLVKEGESSTAINCFAIDFTLNLIQRVCLSQKTVKISAFHFTVEALRKGSQRISQIPSPHISHEETQLAESTTKLLEELKADQGMSETSQTDHLKQTFSGRLSQSGSDEDQKRSNGEADNHFAEAYGRIFEEWRASCGGTTDGASGGGGGQACAAVLQRITGGGFVASETAAERFFLFCCERAIQQTLIEDPRLAHDDDSPRPGGAPLTEGQRPINFKAVDAFTRLVLLLMKCGDKIAMLSCSLAAVVKALLREADQNNGQLNQRPYFRLLHNLIADVGAPDPNFEQNHLQLLSTIAHALFQCSPLRVPSFAFAWLELASHRLFVPKLLKLKDQRGLLMVQRLILQLLYFLQPYLRRARLDNSIKVLYEGTVRVLLVLMHDFPEFLCDYHFTLCDYIPVTCIQVRNLILSAFPRNMRLPDPFTPNLVVDQLPEIQVSPRILANYARTLQQRALKADLDNYARTRNVKLLEVIREKLRLPRSEWLAAGCSCHVPLINALVLYVGVHVSQQGRPTQVGTTAEAQARLQGSAALEIFMHLAHSLDFESRYVFLSAIANHLRFPNTHTHYFSCVMLYLFVEASDESFREQITRVILERLIVHRPHPWGLLITFVELIRNRRYAFWSRSFVTCAPEAIGQLFETVAVTCLGPSGSRPTREP